VSMKTITGALSGTVRPRRVKWVFFSGAMLAALAFATFIAAHNVPVALTEADLEAIPQLLSAAGKPHLTRNVADGRSFEAQTAIVAEVQAAVLATAPKTDPIDFNHEREPKDLLALGYGLCFDRSRVIEKVLTYVGLPSRHVSVYSLGRSQTAIGALLALGTKSHALTEVRTEKGWMAVDPDIAWIGLTHDGNVVSVGALQDNTTTNYDWHALAKTDRNDIFRSKFTYLIGLYSRHGRFYPPYNAVPDINYPQFAANVLAFVGMR
jgi:hypothetical protein